MTRYLSLGIIVVILLAFNIPFASASQTIKISLETPSLAQPSAQDKPVPTAQNREPAADSVKVGRVGVVQVASAAIYKSKSIHSPKYSTVRSDTPLAIVKDKGQWYGVLMSNGKIGWIQSQFVKTAGYDLVAQVPRSSRTNSIASRGGFVRGSDSFAGELIDCVRLYAGVRYVYGGVNPSSGMDCSAFVQRVFRGHGIDLPRTAREQSQVGTPVTYDQLQPGDRLYFACKNPYPDHCGIYVGDGCFVHCSASRNGVGISKLSSGFYGRCLVAARRS